MKIPIGITGGLGAGKDTLADFLIKQVPEMFHKYSFAKPIKDIARTFGFTENQLYVLEDKQRVDDFWEITPREFLQKVGTELFRDNFRQDVWIKFAEKELREHSDKHLLIPDTRFPNEAEFIHKHGGMIIKIVRNTGDYMESRKHVSEDGLDEDLIDLTVDNNGLMNLLSGVAFEISGFIKQKEMKDGTDA